MLRSAALASPRRSADLLYSASRMKGLLAFHRRSIHPDPITLDQTMLGEPLQNPGKDLIMNLQWQARARLRQPGMIRHRRPALKQQKLSQAQAVGTPPLDPALAVDPFKIPDQQHPKIPTRRKRPAAARLRGIVRAAKTLNERIELRQAEDFLQAIVERMALRTRQLRPAQQQVALPLFLPTKRHPSPPAINCGKRITQIPSRQHAGSLVSGALHD